MTRTLPLAALAALLLAAALPAAAATPLVLEAKIPLGDVAGRIDHMAVDPGRGRLFVAELGNDSLGVVDIAARRIVRRIVGLRHPQGIGYAAASDTVYVANAGDGSVRLFQGAGLAPAGRLDLGEDADNIRVDAAAGRVYIGHGDGAIAVIDARSAALLGEIRLKAHPESFRLDTASPRLFVNLPEAREIAVADRKTMRQIGAWRETVHRGNFAMAFDAAEGRILVAFREPPLLVARATDGTTLAALPICGDADDLFVDARRRRVYVSCGAGFLDVLARRDQGYERLARIATVPGARTALFVPALDRLFLAVRASGAEPAAIWVFRPD